MSWIDLSESPFRTSRRTHGAPWVCNLFSKSDAACHRGREEGGRNRRRLRRTSRHSTLAAKCGRHDGRGDAARRRIRLHHRRRGLGRLRAGEPAVRRSETAACCCWKPAAATTGSGFTFRSAICSPSAIRARTGCSRPRRCRASTAARSNYPRGKVIGGSSSINAMIYMRGQAADYDHWRQLGLTGWGWNDVLPIFKKHEHHFLGDGEHHAVGGEWRIEHPRVRWDLLDAFRAAAEQAGIKRIVDFNTGDNEGSAPYHVNQKLGRRWSAARGFLKPVLHRQNLRLETGCLVERVTFDGRRANGVRFRQNGETQGRALPGEVILAAGSIGSMQTLLLSGVGPAAQLSPARHSGRARQARRRREPAGPPAAADDLQGHGRQDAERDVRLAVRPRADFPRLCVAPARAADHGAVAARHLHPLRSKARARQHPVSRAAVVARPVRRAAAHVPGLHRERRQRAADQPRPYSAANRPILPTRRRSSRIISRPTRTAASPPTPSA